MQARRLQKGCLKLDASNSGSKYFRQWRLTAGFDVIADYAERKKGSFGINMLRDFRYSRVVAVILILGAFLPIVHITVLLLNGGFLALLNVWPGSNDSLVNVIMSLISIVLYVFSPRAVVRSLAACGCVFFSILFFFISWLMNRLPKFTRSP